MYREIPIRNTEGEVAAVPMKSTAATPRYYRSYFGADLFVEMTGLTKGFSTDTQREIVDIQGEKSMLLEEASMIVSKKEELQKEMITLEEGKATKKVIADKKKQVEKLEVTLAGLMKRLEEAEAKSSAMEMEILQNETFMNKIGVIENLAYIFAKQADDNVPNNIEDWLDQFEPNAIFEVMEEIINLYNANAETLSKTEKKLVR